MSEVGKLQLERVEPGDWLALQRNVDLLTRQNIGRGPAQARVYNSAAISITTSGTRQFLTFDSERFDTGNYHSTSSNTGRLTVPTAGLYNVGGSIEFPANATGLREISIRLNGATFLVMDDDVSVGAGQPHRLAISTLYQFAAGDYLELGALQTSGGALNVNSSGNYSPEFWIVRLGSQA